MKQEHVYHEKRAGSDRENSLAMTPEKGPRERAPGSGYNNFGPDSNMPGSLSRLLARVFTLLMSGTKQFISGTKQFCPGTKQFISGTKQFIFGTKQFCHGTKQSIFGTKQFCPGTKQSIFGTKRFIPGHETPVSRDEHPVFESNHFPRVEILLARVHHTPVRGTGARSRFQGFSPVTEIINPALARVSSRRGRADSLTI